MQDVVIVQQALIARDWFSIPVISGSRLLIEFHFDADATGWSRYSIWGYEEALPQVIESSWTYLVEGSQLKIAWDDGTTSLIDFELTFETKLSYARNEEHSFDAVLRVSEHLFPKSSGFPAGWLKDYWGRPRKAQVSGEQDND